MANGPAGFLLVLTPSPDNLSVPERRPFVNSSIAKHVAAMIWKKLRKFIEIDPMHSRASLIPAVVALVLPLTSFSAPINAVAESNAQRAQTILDGTSVTGRQLDEAEAEIRASLATGLN